jgi:hypothetical protein
MSAVAVFLAAVFAFSAAQPPAREVTVWAVPGIHKVRPDAPPESSNLVWSGKTRTITVAGAKNEHVPFHVVVSTTPPGSRHEKPASGFFVEAGDLVSSNGRIPGDRVRLYFVHAILCYAESSPVGETGFWPDADWLWIRGSRV